MRLELKRTINIAILVIAGSVSLAQAQTPQGAPLPSLPQPTEPAVTEPKPARL